MAALGSLVVSLAIDMAKFSSDLGRAAHQWERFGKDAARVGKAIGASLAAGAAGSAAIFKAAVDRMDELSKAAQRASMNTEAFSKLAYAGELADVSMQDLQSSMGRLAKAQADALNGTSEQAAMFRALGIQVRNADGTLRDTGEVFFDFADKFQKFKGSPEVVAAGMTIFGRSFQTLIPLLKDGGAGLREAGAEAKAFGVTLTAEVGQRAEAFNDNMTRLGMVTRGFTQTLAAEALGPMKSFTDELVRMAKETSAMHEAAQVGVTGLKLLATAAVATGAGFALAGESIAAVITGLALAAKGEMKAAAAAMEISADEIQGIVERTKKLMASIWNPPQGVPTVRPKRPKENGGDGQMVLPGGKVGTDALSSVIDKALQRDFERMQRMREDAEAFEGFIAQLLAADEAKLRDQADAWRDLADPTRAYMRSLEEIRALVQSGHLSPAEGIAAEFEVEAKRNDEMLRGLQDAAGKTNDAARELGLTFSSAFEDAAVNGEKFSKVLAGIGQDLLRLTIRKSVTEPMTNWLLTALNLGGLFGGGRAAGGPVSAGTTYLVGERGPELFTPKTSGAIVPNHAMGGVNVTNHYRFESGTNVAQLQAFAEQIKADTKADIIDGMRRGRYVTA